jgi:hypothetical protein
MVGVSKNQKQREGKGSLPMEIVSGTRE